jgi:hypothetical protein
MKELAEIKQKIQDDIDFINEAKDEVFDQKADLSIAAVALLLKQVDGTLTDLIELGAKTEHYDKGLGDAIATKVGELATAISQMKPPNITVQASSLDLKPLQAIADNISGQNKVIISLMSRMGEDNDDKLYSTMLSMVERQQQSIAAQNTFIERLMKMEAKEDVAEKKERVEKLTIKYDMGNKFVTEIIPVYKK